METFLTKVISIRELGILLSKSKKEATFPIGMATQRLPLPRVIISTTRKCYFPSFPRNNFTNQNVIKYLVSHLR